MGPPRIAIVDDEESVCRALVRLVRSARLEAETFGSGEEFLETVAARPFDCLVLDLHMPKDDGFEIQDRLARAGLRIPVILITGRDTPETRARALEKGAVAYFRKPVDGEALLEAIAAATASKKNGVH